MATTTITPEITADVTGIEKVLEFVSDVHTPAQANTYATDLLVEVFRPLGEQGMDALYRLSIVSDEPDASRFRDVWMRLFGCELAR